MPAAGPGAGEPGSPLRARLAGEAESHPCGEQGLPSLASPPLKLARDWVLQDLRSVRGLSFTSWMLACPWGAGKAGHPVRE